MVLKYLQAGPMYGQAINLNFYHNSTRLQWATVGNQIFKSECTIRRSFICRTSRGAKLQMLQN